MLAKIKLPSYFSHLGTREKLQLICNHSEKKAHKNNFIAKNYQHSQLSLLDIKTNLKTQEEEALRHKMTVIPKASESSQIM